MLLYKIIAVYLQNILTLCNSGNLSQGNVTKVKRKPPFHLSTALHCHAEFTFPNEDKHFLAWYFCLFTSISRMWMPEFCQPCYLEIFLSVLVAWIPLLGCVSFLSSNKEDSGVLTFTWMKGAVHTKNLCSLYVNTICSSNNQVSDFTA